MPPRTWTQPGSTRHRWLWLAVLFAVVPGWDSKAAGTARSGLHPGRADSPAHSCGCGDRCRGAACCCARRTEATPAAPARPAATPVVAAGPCLESAPCSPWGLPGGSASTDLPSPKATLSRGCDPRPPAQPGRWLLPPDPGAGPAARADRIDDPPESPPHAPARATA